MAQPIWNTPTGSLGAYSSSIDINPVIELSVNSGIVNPNVTFNLISGDLPSGVFLSSNGTIYGKPNVVPEITKYIFVIRATNADGEIRDRSFFIEISGYAGPKFDISSGSLLETFDSIWTEKYVPFTNFYADNPVEISLVQGSLPPGLEINREGLIRGYPNIPQIEVNFKKIVSIGIETKAITNSITCYSTIDFVPYRPIVFSGTVFGGIVANKTYYIKEILNSSEFTISSSQYGPEIYLISGTGFMNITLPDTVLGQPTSKTYNFDLILESPIGNDLKSYSITVINQNLSLSKGGPGYPYLTRIPTILNTRPLSFSVAGSDPYFAYYLFPDDAKNNTYPPNELALMGNYESDNYFAFKIIGYTFDNYPLKYQFVGLPAGMIGDVNTGWIYGTPYLNTDTIGKYSFTVRVYKATDPAIQSGLFNFSLYIYRTITNTIVWVSPEDLGYIYNGTISNKRIIANGDVSLEYRIVSGSLPPNLILETNGEITGVVAYQPTSNILPLGSSTLYSFVVESYSSMFPVINSTKEFKMTVIQEFEEPMDTIYMKATPSVSDRELINSLLLDENIIPESYLYRADDINFGKAKNVTYEHQYGVYANNINQYLLAVERSFYWRNITLGPLETAIAKDENNQIIYEVVYSKIIDDLVNEKGESINFEIRWPQPINLNLGPWITSVTDVFVSYTDINQQPFTASLTPGYAEVLWPNSLQNMNKQIADVLNVQYDSKILPLWMTSQQENGSTLGFTRAWVICYTKPGFSKIVKNNIETKWKNQYGEINKLNQINFTLDRFSVDKSATYNYDNFFTPPAWTGLPSGTPVPDPINSKDFYVLFPRKTILPDATQL